MNKKGFTVVELMTTFMLISMIALLLIRLTITLKEIYVNGDLKTVLLTKQGTMTDKIYKDLNDNKLTAINSCENNVTNCIELVYDTGTKIFKIDKDKKTITYDNYTIKLVKGSSFGNTVINKYNNDSGDILSLKVPINNKLVKGDYGLNIVHQIDSDVIIDSSISFDTSNTGITVTFDPNGGTVEKNTKSVTLNEKYGLLPIPKRDGYRFLGWNLEIGGVSNIYNQLDYILNDSPTPIDTLYYPTSENLKYVFKFSPLEERMMGIIGNSSDDDKKFGLSFWRNQYYIGSSRGLLSKSYEVDKDYIVEVSVNNGTFINKVNGVTSTAEYNGNLYKNSSIGLFSTKIDSGWQLNDNSHEMQYSIMKLYYLKIYDNNKIVRDFLPCVRISDSTVGLYDLVTDKFYTTSEEGSIKSGNIVNNYVNYSTKVTQNKNHTLKAIWEKSNDNIVVAYKYNESNNGKKCINGEENTCVETKCYEDTSKDACPQGTIIKYKVNNDEEKYFYVLHDDGKKMTLQQRENIVKNIAWHSGSNDNSQGPDTILESLESATSGWTNVNQIEYTPGTTNLYENKFTGCTYNGGSSGDYKTVCNTNKYTMNKKTARARIITAQETSSTGCLVWKDGSQYSNIMGNSINASNNGSCPDWMYNYLYQSTSFGGSYDDNSDNESNQKVYAYWTMSANADSNDSAWNVTRNGRFDFADKTTSAIIGARAVIEIDK